MLKSPHHRLGHKRGKIWVLTASLGYTTPPGVAGNVKHRRESPSDAVGGSLHSCNAGRICGHLRRESGSESQGDRENGLVAVNHIARHQEGYAETRTLNGHILKRVGGGGVSDIHERTDLTGSRHGEKQFTASLRIPVGTLIELPYFLIEGHATEQILNPDIDISIRLTVERGFGAGKACKRYRKQKQ